jgi:hypothetical protein
VLAGPYGTRLVAAQTPGNGSEPLRQLRRRAVCLLALDAIDLPATAAIMKRYESSGLQFADAALAHLAER